MRAESQLEVILAHLDGENIEVHRNKMWCDYMSQLRPMLEEMRYGTLFRVKREPRSLWAEQDGQRLTGVCWSGEKVAIAEVSGACTLVEFREVL